MPDGDNVHYRPRQKKLNQAYEMLLEKQSLGDVAFRVQSELASLVRKYGNEPRELIDHTVNLLATIKQNMANGDEYHHHIACEKIIDASEQILGKRRGLSIVIDACKASLLDFDPSCSIEEVTKLISLDYVWRIYDADFAERLPLYFHNAPTEMTQQDIDVSLLELRHHMSPYIEEIAERFVRMDDVKKVQRIKITARDFDNDNEEDIYGGVF